MKQILLFYSVKISSLQAFGRQKKSLKNKGRLIDEPSIDYKMQKTICLCLFLLNKYSFAAIRIFETGFGKTPMCAGKFGVAQQTNIFDVCHQLKSEF